MAYWLQDDYLFIYGGVAAGNTTSVRQALINHNPSFYLKDVWKFHIPTKKWAPFRANKLPRLAGHTATVVDDMVFVIGGRHRDNVFSQKIYILNTTTGVWNYVTPHGARLGYMSDHATAYHAASRSIIVSGGFVPSRAVNNQRTSRILALSIDHFIWRVLASDNAEPIALHSMLLYNSNLVFFGGLRHVHWQVEECHANDIQIFNLDCLSWHTILDERYVHTCIQSKL